MAGRLLRSIVPHANVREEAALTALPVHLAAGRDRRAAADALASRYGGRVGLEGVLADLDRLGHDLLSSGSAARWAFSWDHEDNRSKRWWPQGITSSADADPTSEEYAGRRLLVTSSYSKKLDGVSKGCRITVVDVTDEGRVRYRHVLLADVRLTAAGEPVVQPVHAHAGGIVWSGGLLHVAATRSGIHTFRLDDITAVPPEVGLGHRSVLPLHRTWAARTEDGAEPMRYSFLSLGRDGGTRSLLAGEYGNGRSTRRIVTYALDGEGAPATDAQGTAAPTLLCAQGPSRMQGAVSVDGRLHVVTSNGRRGRGSLWVGPPDRLTRVKRVLPPGPEDITYWPSRDELWTVTEYPGRRQVLALERSRFSSAG